MKKYLREIYRRIIFRLSARNSSIFRIYYSALYKPRPNTIAALLDDYSKSIPQFTVLQVGANDGITHDPIHKFIKRDHWQGVLLEPQKDVFDKYLSKIYALDVGIHTVHAALGHEDGTQAIFKIGFSQARWATGLTSFRREVLEEAFKSGHVARQAAKEGVPIPSETEQQIVADMVPVISVSTIRSNYQLAKIDLLQIDTEGFDFEIIKMFDLGQDPPKAIVYENIHLSIQDAITCKQYLSKSNYLVRDYAGNTVAMQSPSTKLRKYFSP